MLLRRGGQHLANQRLELARALSRVMPRPVYLPLSAHTGEGIDGWVEWLERLGRAERRSILTLRVE